MPLSENANIQTDYLGTPDFPPLGERWRSSHMSRSERIVTEAADLRTLALGLYEITSTASTNGESWKVTIDGVQVPFTTGASVAATATAIYNALAGVFGPGKALESQLASGGLTVDNDTVSIAFVDGKSRTIAVTAVSGGAVSTFVAGWSVNPFQPVNHKPGYWVAYDPSGFDPTATRIKDLSATSDRIIGVPVLEGASLEDYHVVDPVGISGPFWPAGRPMSVMVRGQLIMQAAETINAADVGSIVYAVAVGANKGQCVKSGGGTHEVWTGTVVANNGDTVGVTIDSLPVINVVSTASASATATLLANAINDQADAAAIVTATTNGASLILTFKDYSAHTVTANSPATADVTPLSATTPAAEQTAIATNSRFLTPAAAGSRVAVNIMEG